MDTQRWVPPLFDTAPCSERHRLLVTCVCAPAEPAREAWGQVTALFGGLEGTRGWVRSGPARRLLPLLATRADQLGLPDALHDECRAATAESWALNERLLEAVGPVLEQLAGRVRVAAMKGLALVGDAYCPHHLRTVGDADLVVWRNDILPARRVLTEHGWTPTGSAERGTRTRRRAAPDQVHLAQEWRHRSGATIDLHSVLAPSLPAHVLDDACWDRCAPLAGPHPLHATGVRRLGAEDHLVALAAQLWRSLNATVVHPWVDVHRLRATSSIDAGTMWRIAQRATATVRLQTTLRTLAELVATTHDESDVDTAPASPPRRALQREQRIVVATAWEHLDHREGLDMLDHFRRHVVATSAASPARTQLATAVGILATAARRRLAGRRSTSAPSAPPLRWWGEAEDGAVVALSSTGSSPAEVMGHVWPPSGLRPLATRPATAPRLTLDITAPPAAEPRIHVDGGFAATGWVRLESTLGLFAADHLRELVAIHAAVLQLGDHHVLVPGASHTGKSTLCLAAAATGFTIGSDEYALVDPASGMVQPWHRSVHERTATGTRQVPAARTTRTLPVSMVAAVRYDAAFAGAGEPPLEVHPLSPGELVTVLVTNSVAARRRPQSVLSAATAIAATAVGVHGRRGEALPAAAALHALADSANRGRSRADRP